MRFIFLIISSITILFLNYYFINSSNHIFVLSFFISFLLCYFFVRYAHRLKLLSLPKSHSTHTKPVAIGGGIAIYISFLFGALLLDISNTLILGASLFFSIGLIDDISNLLNKKISPLLRLFLQFISVLFAIKSGLIVHYISNPFGGTFELSDPISSVITIFWILTCVNAVNFLDGIDGLASGVVSISSIVLFLLTIFVTGSSYIVTLSSLLLAFSIVPYIFFNFNPAKLYMDDSGSYLLGFLIGALAMEGGGRVATTFLVLAIPLIDIFTVILKRLYLKKSIFKGDKTSHFHHVLLNIGWSPRKITLSIWLFTIFIGCLSLFLDTKGKLILVILYSVFFVFTSFRLDQEVKKSNKI